MGRSGVHRPWAEVLLEQQLDRVGDGLQQSEGPDPGGAQPRLDAGADLALHPYEDDGRHGDQGGDGSDRDEAVDEGGGQGRQLLADEVAEGMGFRVGLHLSMSGMIRSRVERMATRSAILPPAAISFRAARLEKPGLRLLIR